MANKRYFKIIENVEFYEKTWEKKTITIVPFYKKTKKHRYCLCFIRVNDTTFLTLKEFNKKYSRFTSWSTSPFEKKSMFRFKSEYTYAEVRELRKHNSTYKFKYISDKELNKNITHYFIAQL